MEVDMLVGTAAITALLVVLHLLLTWMQNVGNTKEKKHENIRTNSMVPDSGCDGAQIEKGCCSTPPVRLAMSVTGAAPGPEIVYADYAGAPPYSPHMIRAYTEDMLIHQYEYTNPHSDTSGKVSAISQKMSRLREKTLEMCNTNGCEYLAVITHGATDGCRLLSSIYPWSSNTIFMPLNDNHTSVIGMREVAVKQGASVMCLEREHVHHVHIRKGQCSEKTTLLALPLESNFSGKRYNLNAVIEHAKEMTTNSGVWHVLLDASRACASYPPDLSASGGKLPDFVLISYYKMFGFPTGVGCLLIKRGLLEMLKKSYFGGGTIEAAVAENMFHIPKRGVGMFEDGTPSFLSIPAALAGFDWIQSELGGFCEVEQRASLVARYLASELLKMRHSNGTHVCKVYGCWGRILNENIQNYSNIQGPTVCFNVKNAQGSWVGASVVDRIAKMHNVHVRSGGLCNPGALREAIGVTVEDMMSWKDHGFSCGGAIDVINGCPTGAVRASFGYASTIKEACDIVSVIHRCFLDIGSKQLGHISEGSGVVDAEVQKIYIYPVKSCRGQRVDSWPVDWSGLKYDRHFKIVGEHGKPLNPKQCVNLCRIKPAIHLLRRKLTLEDVVTGSSASMDLLQPEYGQINQWLTNVLGISCKIVSINQILESDRDHMDRDAQCSVKSFVNDASVLVIDQSCLDHLYVQCNRPDEDMDTFLMRFRPNIVLKQTESGYIRLYGSEKWASIERNDVKILEKSKICTRCTSIQHHPRTGCVSKIRILEAISASKAKLGLDTLLGFGVLYNVGSADAVGLEMKEGMHVKCVT